MIHIRIREKAQYRYLYLYLFSYMVPKESHLNSFCYFSLSVFTFDHICIQKRINTYKTFKNYVQLMISDIIFNKHLMKYLRVIMVHD